MIYDITQELFSCAVYPGDPSPVRTPLASLEQGDIINLTALSLCAHNGTHLDAPAHFIKGGKTIDEVDPTAYLGVCYVTHHEGNVTATDAEAILRKAAEKDAADRILIRGSATVTEAAAHVFAKARIKLIGGESQSVGPEDAPMAVHLILLGAEILLLEGVALSHVPEGVYFLTAAPLKLGGCEGAPCRALLMDMP
ncbi:MAG: cyclase family protein [Clostridia bacterium]|nr:cyclase family protein [Clostridia bacterium]